MKNAPPFKTSKATLAILQDHYPERLYKFLILHAPRLDPTFLLLPAPSRAAACVLRLLQCVIKSCVRAVQARAVALPRVLQDDLALHRPRSSLYPSSAPVMIMYDVSTGRAW